MTKVDLLIINASELLTMIDGLGIIKDGAMASSDGKIIEVDSTDVLKSKYTAQETIDATGKVVTPGLVDCHTHLVFAGTREHEFEMRLFGKTYLEILESGGGILSTVEAMRVTSKEDLVQHGHKWLSVMKNYGVTTVEIKTGYGLNYETEKKMLGTEGIKGKLL